MSYPAISLTTAIAGRHRRPQKRLQTPRQPPVYPNSIPDYRACNSLTPPPLSSRCLSVSTGGFGLKHVLRRDWIVFMSAATAKPCWHILLLRFEHLIKLDVAFLHEFIHLLRHKPDLLRHWVTFAVG